MVEVVYLPVTCSHCDEAPCIKAAKNGAITKRADGIVIIDPEEANGQKQRVAACPYEAVYWNEEKQLAAQAWPLGAHPCLGKRLIRKVYEADPLVCANCKGPMRVIALIEDSTVVRRILEHLGCRVPEPAERGPPAQVPERPRNALIPITYHPVRDIA